MAFLFDVVLRGSSGRYDNVTNILYFGSTAPVDFVEEQQIRPFVADLVQLIKRCPRKPTLFIDFENIRIDPALVTTYRQIIGTLRTHVLATYRYNMPRSVGGTLTSAVVRTSNMKERTAGNVFPDKESALAAYLAASKTSPRQPSR